MTRIDVAAAGDVESAQALAVEVDGLCLLLVVDEGVIRAIQGECTHEEWPLDDGVVWRGTITCPLHGSRFDLLTGSVLDPPATEPLTTYPVIIENGRVLLDRP